MSAQQLFIVASIEDALMYEMFTAIVLADTDEKSDGVPWILPTMPREVRDFDSDHSSVVCYKSIDTLDWKKLKTTHLSQMPSLVEMIRLNPDFPIHGSLAVDIENKYGKKIDKLIHKLKLPSFVVIALTMDSTTMTNLVMNRDLVEGMIELKAIPSEWMTKIKADVRYSSDRKTNMLYRSKILNKFIKVAKDYLLV